MGYHPLPLSPPGRESSSTGTPACDIACELQPLTGHRQECLCTAGAVKALVTPSLMDSRRRAAQERKLRAPLMCYPLPGTVVSGEPKWYVVVIMKATRRPSRFHVIVDAADRLTEEEQETLVTLLNRRLAERRRAELVRDIREGQQEFERGALRPSTPEKIVKEILA